MDVTRIEALQRLVETWTTRVVAVKTRWPQADTHPDEMYLQGLLSALQILQWPAAEELTVEGAIFAAALAAGDPGEQQPAARAA